MKLTREQLEKYYEDGYSVLPECFSQAEVRVMKNELSAIFAEDSLRRVIEQDGRKVRSVYGSYTTNKVFHRLSCHPRIVLPANQILDSQVYVYQFKINAKSAFGGDVWQWHQDYVFWHKEDGMPSARVTNVAIFLDEVTEFNGPMFFIPGSHRHGVIEVDARNGKPLDGAERPGAYKRSPKWISNLTADLKYSLDLEVVKELVKNYGIVAPKGPSGSAIFFDGNIVHASTNNISPFDRAVVILTYNSVENLPSPIENPRPDFLCSRNFEPVSPLPDDILLQ